MKLMIQKMLRFFLLILLCILALPTLGKVSTGKNSKSINNTDEALKYNLDQLRHFDSLDIKDSIRHYIEIGEILCNQIELSSNTPTKLHKTVADMYSLMASRHYYFNDLAEAFIGFQKAAEIYQLLDIKYELAQSLNNMALIYLKIGNQIKSLDYFQRATFIFIDIKDSNGIALGYNSIAKIYQDQKDYQRTQEYLNDALTIGRKLGDYDVLSSILNSIANLKKELGDQDGALVLYREALSISKYAKNEIKTALILNSLGVINKDRGNLEDAKMYFERAYQIALKNNSDYGISFILVNLADYYYLSKSYNKAVELANEALEISDQTANDEARYKAVNVLIKIFNEQEDWKRTVYYQTMLIEQNKKREEQVIDQISQQETIRYKLEKEHYITQNKEVKANLLREKEIQQLNLFYGIFIVVLVLSLTFSLIIYFRLRSSRERNKDITKQSEEHKLLLQEVHHRVKNNFQIVSSMLRLQSYNFHNEELRQNFEEAVNRINAMAIVHDVIYRQEKFSDIDAKNYLEKLVRNLHKTGDSRIIIEIESEEIPFKIETLINLGIALNELITNSFKHAFDDSIAQPKIRISLRTIEAKTYEMKYRDNGVGISEDTFTSGFGMELIETIISNFEGSVELSREKNWNTVIRITFKEF